MLKQDIIKKASDYLEHSEDNRTNKKGQYADLAPSDFPKA